MLSEHLQGYKLILASGSPRRQQFFRELGLDFEIRLKPTEERYPPYLKGSAIADYLADLKARAFEGSLNPGEILVTSDTVVWHRNKSLEKAANAQEAQQMLQTLSNDWHEVITSVCLMTQTEKRIVNSSTQVKFKALTNQEIQYYIATYQPFDKAGAYGIQEWLGHIGIEEIQGSYTNVMGLPTQLFYKTLMAIVD